MRYLLLALILFPIQANAICLTLNLQRLDGTVDFRQEPTPTENFYVQALGSCNYFVTIDNAGAASYATRVLKKSGGAEVPISVCTDSACNRHWKNYPEITSAADILSGTFRLSILQTQAFSYYPRMGSADYQPYGDYESNFTVRLYEGDFNGTRTLRDTENVRIRTTILKQIDLSLVSTGAPFDSAATAKTLDFGLLAAGKEMGFDLVIKYNAGYRLRLSSTNSGALKNGSSSVPYTLYISNSPVTLSGSASSPVTVSQGSGTSAAAGLRFAGRVAIGSLGNAPAGTYQDTVTLTVSTNE